jgi:hypothetical protein
MLTETVSTEEEKEFSFPGLVWQIINHEAFIKQSQLA